MSGIAAHKPYYGFLGQPSKPYIFSNNHLTFRSWIDNRVTDIALKVFGSGALVMGACITIGASVIAGVATIPITLVLGLIGVGVLCLSARGEFKRYYDPHVLKKYRREAQDLSKSYELLDKNSELTLEQRKNMIKPLSHLLKSHRNLSTLLMYEILQPKDLKKIVALEVKYLSFFQAEEIYEQIRITAQKLNKLSIYHTIRGELDPHRQRFHQYNIDCKDCFNKTGQISYKDLQAAEKKINELLSLLNMYIDSGILGKKDELEKMQQEYKELQRLYKASVGNGNDSIRAQEKKELNIVNGNNDRYFSHDSHYIISKEQENFLKGMKAIYGEEEKRYMTLDKEYRCNIDPIFLRNEGHDMDPEDQRLLTMFQQKYDDAKATIQQESQEKLHSYITTYVSEPLKQAVEQLCAHRQEVDKASQKELQRVHTTLDAFRGEFERVHITAITQYYQGLSNIYTAFANALNS